MSDKTTIFDLYAGESEPITLTDAEGRSVTVKFLKRNEAQRQEAVEYANSKRSKYLDVREERAKEVRLGRFSTLTQPQLVEARIAFMDAQVEVQGLDLFDDLEPGESDAPETIEDLEAQRKERKEKYLAERREELEALTKEEILEDMVQTAIEQEYTINGSVAHIRMTIVLTCVAAETNEHIFESIDQLNTLKPAAVAELHDKLNTFLLSENEKNSRRLANDPNSSRTTD